LKARVERRLLETLAQSIGGLTFGAVLQALRCDFPELDAATLRCVIRERVAEGQLSYTLRLGSSRIALGGNQPERVSERIYRTAASGPLPHGAVSLRLTDGTAFGAGDHPTTRMMLRGLDQALAAGQCSKEAALLRVLDVGTGNGVLAIAALLLGVGAAVGVDIDPQACDEARINALEHGVAQRLRLVTGTVRDIGQTRFDLVLANLRPPTLAGLLPELTAFLEEGGALILSGFRREEQPAVERQLPDGWRTVWQDHDRDWAALVAQWGSSDFRGIFRGIPKGR
jgi:ribosomal protein L11 methyltransferase